MPRRLPRGRYALSPEEVERAQRSRLCLAMAEVMAEKGYVATSVEDVLRRAVVSRQTFYKIFDSKLDCFMAAFDGAGALLLERVLSAVGTDRPGEPGRGAAGDLVDRFERVITVYLDVLASELPFARLFLVEVYAAGPEAVARRSELQGSLGAYLADVLEVTGDAGRYTCHVLVAAISAMVTPPVARNDPDALRGVGPPVVEHVRRLAAAGVFGS